MGIVLLNALCCTARAKSHALRAEGNQTDFGELPADLKENIEVLTPLTSPHLFVSVSAYPVRLVCPCI